MNIPGMRLVSNLLKHEGFFRYFHNFSWMLTGQALSMLVAFFMGAYIARYLGPGQFGSLNFVLSFVGLFGFLIGFGIDGILVRELVARPEDRGRLIGSGFWIKSFGGALAFLATNAVAYFTNIEPDVRWLIFVFSLTFLLHGFSVASSFFQAEVLAKRNVQAQMIATGVVTILKLIAIWSGAALFWFVWIYVIEALISTLVIFFIYRFRHGHIYWSPDLSVIKALLLDSWPLMFTTAAASIYMRIDQTMLKYMIDDTAVGLYSVAVKLSEMWYFLPNLICAAIFPAIINAMKTDRIEYLRRIRHLNWLMVSLALLITLPVYLFSELIVHVVFGTAYNGAIWPLQIYIWSTLPVFLMASLNQRLIAENATKSLFLATFLGAIINIALNLILIPLYSMTGAAIATVISYLIPLGVAYGYIIVMNDRHKRKAL